MRDLKPGEFHWRDGIIFARLPDGGVSIEIPGTPGLTMAREFVIPPNEWASIILHCARDPNDSFAPHPSIEDADAFHRVTR